MKLTLAQQTTRDIGYFRRWRTGASIASLARRAKVTPGTMTRWIQHGHLIVAVRRAERATRLRERR